MSLETNWMFATQQKWYGRSNPNVPRTKQGTRWDEEERSQLVSAWRMGRTICEIADHHKRTPTGITSQLEELLGSSYDRWWDNPGMSVPAKALQKMSKSASKGNIEGQLKAKFHQLASLETLKVTVLQEIAALQAVLDDPIPLAFTGDPYADQTEAGAAPAVEP